MVQALHIHTCTCTCNLCVWHSHTPHHLSEERKSLWSTMIHVLIHVHVHVSYCSVFFPLPAGLSPVHLATREASIDVLKFLFQMRADKNAMVRLRGTTFNIRTCSIGLYIYMYVYNVAYIHVRIYMYMCIMIQYLWCNCGTLVMILYTQFDAIIQYTVEAIVQYTCDDHTYLWLNCYGMLWQYFWWHTLIHVYIAHVLCTCTSDSIAMGCCDNSSHTVDDILYIECVCVCVVYLWHNCYMYMYVNTFTQLMQYVSGMINVML